MASTSAAYLVIRKRKAREKVAAEVSDVEIETQDDGDVVIRNAEGGHWIATLEDNQPGEDDQENSADTKLEYLTEEEGADGQLAKRIQRVLSRYRAR